MNQDKKIIYGKIEEIRSVIRDFEMQRENFLIIEGSLVDKEKIKQYLKEYEEEISKLGFLSKDHYDQLKRLLIDAD